MREGSTRKYWLEGDLLMTRGDICANGWLTEIAVVRDP